MKCPKCGAELFPGKTKCVFCAYNEKEKIKTSDVFIADDAMKEEPKSKDEKTILDIQDSFEKKMKSQEQKEEGLDKEMDALEQQYQDEAYKEKKGKGEDMVQKALAMKVYSKLTFPLFIFGGLILVYSYWMDRGHARHQVMVVGGLVLGLMVLIEYLTRRSKEKSRPGPAPEKDEQDPEEKTEG